MESFRQRFFHLINDFAYIEVSDFSPCREGVCSLTASAAVASDHTLGGLKQQNLSSHSSGCQQPKPRCWQGWSPLAALRLKPFRLLGAASNP